MKAVKKFIDNALDFPKIDGRKAKVSEVLIETYVNSIKVCKDNYYEFNICVNPNAKIQIPIKSDDEFNPQYDSAHLYLDNSDATLIGKFQLSYDDAKRYTGRLKRTCKVKRAHFAKPIHVKMFANIQKTYELVVLRLLLYKSYEEQV